MGKGLLFFCCSCCILVLTIVNLSVGPIVSGTVKRFFSNGYGDWGTLNCEGAKDAWDADKDDPAKTDDQVKYTSKYWYDTCQRAKGMHDMEYTSFIFDIVIGFICGLLGLLHLFDLKKDFVSNTGLIGLICGVVGFALSLVYVIFNGLVYTTVYVNNQITGSNGIYKRDGDYAIAEKDGDKFKCLYFDDPANSNSIFAKINDLGKKQYNYNKDGIEDYEKLDPKCIDYENDGTNPVVSDIVRDLCITKETLSFSEVDSSYRTANKFDSCEMIYLNDDLDQQGIDNKDLSDRFLTTLILCLIVCLASIGLALFGFLLFRTPGDF